MLTSIGLYFFDYLTAATLLLTLVFLFWKFLRQPVARLMLARWTLAALLFLAVLCLLPGRMPLGVSLTEPFGDVEIATETLPIVMPMYTPSEIQNDVEAKVGISLPSNLPTPPRKPIFIGARHIGASLSPAAALAVLQIIATLLILGRLLLGAVCAARICRKATLFGSTLKVPVLESEEMAAPAVLGLFRPKILLPAFFFLDRDAESLRLTLEHERAHIRHGDLRLLAFWQLLLPLLVLHPLYWLFRNRLRREQEFLVDAAVAETTRQRDRYAEELLEWAKRSREKPRHLVSLLGLASMIGIVE